MSSLPFLPPLFLEDSPLPAHLPPDSQLVNLGKQCTLEDRFQQILQRFNWVTHKIKDRPHFLSALHFNRCSNLSAQSCPISLVKSRKFWAIVQLASRLHYEGNWDFCTFFYIGNITNHSEMLKNKKCWERKKEFDICLYQYNQSFVLK